jgi:hypothetical protein
VSRSQRVPFLLTGAARRIEVLPLVEQTTRALFLAFTLCSVAFYAVRFWSVYAAGELFHRLGFDWSLFYAQAMALRSGAGPGIYDQSVIDEYLQPLLRYYGGPETALGGWPQPYPPWFAASFVPFTVLPANIGYAVWLGASLLAALFLGYRVWQILPELGRFGAPAAVLAAVPVAWGLFLGQPAVLLAVPVSEMFISFKAGRDFRAGLWLAVLLLKPQYALLFGVFILWKMRWRAAAGAAIGGLAIVALGLLTGGVQSFVRYGAVLQAIGDFHDTVAGPTLMMNWRAIVLAVRPGIGEGFGLVLVGALSGLTMLAALLLFRGKWDPQSPSFGPRFCALTLGALIGSYHSHPHGAALLVVPLASAWPAPMFRSATRFALWAAVYAPSFFVLWITGVVSHMSVSPDPSVPLWTVWPNVLPAVLFVLAFALMCADLWRARNDYAYRA